jgi:hypothetical protein
MELIQLTEEEMTEINGNRDSCDPGWGPCMGAGNYDIIDLLIAIIKSWKNEGTSSSNVSSSNSCGTSTRSNVSNSSNDCGASTPK